MVDGQLNGVRKRSPVLDLNQALTKEDEEEEEEHHTQSMGPPWLHARPQKPWLQLNDPDQAGDEEQKQRTLDANPNYLSSEHHQPFAGKPYIHAVEQQAVGENPNLLHKEQQLQGFLENPSHPSLGTEQSFHVIDIWKSNSDTTGDLTQNFSLMEDGTQSQKNSTVLSSLGPVWECEQASLPLLRRSLSPVSPPPQRKSLSPVSPEQGLPKEVPEAALRRGRSPGKGGSTYRSPVRAHMSGGDAFSKRRRERDDSLSPRNFFKRRRDRSLSLSPAGRSSRVGRSRSRSPPMRRYSPPRSRYSPRARYSPRRRSPPLNYRPKRRPWSPPPNRNTGLGKPGRNLFIAGFSFGTTERDLEKKFSRYGHVRDVRIVRDKRSGDSRGFGFLSLDRDENADAAIRGLDQTEWNGRIVLVEKAKGTN
eukprot:c11525_g1_i1 orf=296-1555(-)